MATRIPVTWILSCPPSGSGRAVFDNVPRDSDVDTFYPTPTGFDIWGSHSSFEAPRNMAGLYAVPYRAIDGDWDEPLERRSADVDASVLRDTDAHAPLLPVGGVATPVATRSTPDSGFALSAAHTAPSTAYTTPDPYTSGNSGQVPARGPAFVPLSAVPSYVTNGASSVRSNDEPVANPLFLSQLVPTSTRNIQHFATSMSLRLRWSTLRCHLKQARFGVLAAL